MKQRKFELTIKKRKKIEKIKKKTKRLIKRLIKRVTKRLRRKIMGGVGKTLNCSGDITVDESALYKGKNFFKKKCTNECEKEICRILLEQQLAGNAHENIVTIYYVGPDEDGKDCVIMELLHLFSFKTPNI